MSLHLHLARSPVPTTLVIIAALRGAVVVHIGTCLRLLAVELISTAGPTVYVPLSVSLLVGVNNAK